MPTPRITHLVTAVLVLSVAAAACSGTSGDDVQVSKGDGTSPTVSAEGAGGDTPSTAPSTTRPPTGSGEPVTLAFAGDVNFQNQESAVVSSPDSVLAAIAPDLGGADLTMVNLEAALGAAGSPQPKSFTFQLPEQALQALGAAGVDVVTMANNHGMDYGSAGLQDSLRIKATSGFPILGIGANEAEAYAPWITEAKGQRIGFIGANDVFDSSMRASWTAGPDQPGLASAEEDRQDRLVQVIQATRPQVDTLVVFLHYGTEKETCPNPRQQDLARLLTTAGADIVVGAHPHRLQGMGFMGAQFVAYSLGNFAFQAQSPEGAATGVLVVTATGRRIDGYDWKPAVIRNSIPHPLTGAAADAAQATMTERQACAGLTPTAGGAPG